MSTNTSVLTIINTNDTTLRAWSQGVHAALLAVGLTAGADTGQADLTTITRPLNNASAGYKIYKFASNEFYLRVDFAGSGNVNGEGQVGCAIWFQIGTGTDGAGNLSGNKSSVFKVDFHNSGGAVNHYFSGDGTWLSCAFNCGVSTSLGSVISFAKSRNSSGALTGEYLHISGQCCLSDAGSFGVTNRPNRFQQIVYTVANGGSQPPLGYFDAGWYTVWPGVSNVAMGGAHSAQGTLTGSGAKGLGVQPIFAFQGYPDNWDGVAAWCFQDDIPGGSTVPLLVYGTQKNFLMPGIMYCNTNNLPNTNRVSMVIPWF